MREPSHTTSREDVEIEELQREQTELEAQRQRKRLRVFQIVFCGLVSSYLISAPEFQGPITMAGNALALLIALMSIGIGEIKKNGRIARGLLMVAISTCLAATAVESGWGQSDGTWSLAILPIIASCLYSVRGTLAWTLWSGLILTALLVCGSIDALSIPWKAQTPPQLLSTRLSGQIAYAVVIYVAISNRVSRFLELKRMQAQLEQEHQRSVAANLAKARFLTRMSHELRTPMNGLLGMTQHLRGRSLHKTQLEDLALVQRCGQNVLTLLNDALDLRRIEGGRFASLSRPTDLCALLQETRELFQANAQLKGVPIRIESEHPHCWVNVDVTRLRQVLTNLVGNALKFSDIGTIHIALERRQSRTREDGQQEIQVQIQVRDQGIGMDPTQVSLLLEQWQENQERRAALSPSTGQGLHISQNLISDMGGQFHVQSELGVGSTFSISMWLEQSEASNPSSPTEGCKPSATRALGPETPVLIVDDNPINLRVASLTLRSIGVPSETAQSGQAAVDMARAKSYRAIFMDLRMPGMDGFQTTRVILQDCPACKDAPIIALTANAYEQDRKAAREAGMVGFIAKPFQARDLRNEMQRLGVDVPESEPKADTSPATDQVKAVGLG